MRKLADLIPVLTVVMLVAVGGAGCTAKMKAAYHQTRADRFYDAGQFDQAGIEYKNVLRNSPQNARAWSRLGFIYFDQGRLGEAAQILGRAAELATNDVAVRLKLGTIYLEAGRLKEAWDAACFVLDKSPGDVQAPILLSEAAATNQIAEARLRLQKISPTGGTAPIEVALGVLSIRQGDLKTAEADFVRAETLDPKFSDACSALGSLYAAQNDLKQADQEFKKATDLAPPRSGKALQYAQFKILTGESAVGKQMLEDAVKKTPDYLPAWMALAQLAGSEKRNADGVSLLGNVLSRDPQNLEALMLKGRLELQQGEAVKAMADFTVMAKMFPKLPVVSYQLAQAHLANNETDKAIADLNQALNLNPKYADAILSLAEIQIRNGNIAPAIGALQQLTRRMPQIVPARLLLADAYGASGSLGSAVQIYRELAKAAPKNPQFHLLLGTALLRQTNNPEARVEFDQALKLAPDYLPALEQVVNLDLREKQYAAARQCVRQQIGQNPKAAALQLLLANVLVAAGETNQAESTLQKAIELQPDSEQAYLMLAQLHTAAHQNQKALADLQTALARNPNNPRVLMLMGMTYDAEKDYQDAGDAYEKLLAVTPNNGLALNNLACLCAEHLGQLDKGWQLARRARELAPMDPSIADTLGWILYQKGQFFSALNLLRESAAKLYAVSEVQYHLGMTYYRMGDEAGARTTFQRALQLTEDFPERNECIQCLAVLAIDAKTAGTEERARLEKRVTSQPNDPVALLRLAAIYQREGTVDKAMATYEAALQAAPQNTLAMVNLARLYAPRDAKKAFGLAKAAYALTPNDPVVTHTLGRLAFLTGDYRWALSLLQLTDQVQPQNAEVLYDLAEALYSVGRASEARTAMENALQTGTAFSQTNQARQFLAMTDLADRPAQALAAQSQVDEILKSAPDFMPALMARATIAEQKSEPAAAAQILEGLLQLHPDFVPAQKQLAILYAKTPDAEDKAYALAIKARKALPADPEIAKTLGIIVFHQGDYARAETLLQDGARQRGQDAELLYYLGVAQYHLKNRTESKATLQRALSLNLSGTQVVEARQILLKLE